MNNCQNDNSLTCLETTDMHSRESTLERPPEYSVIVQARDSIPTNDSLEFKDRYGQLCLKIIQIDINASWVLCLFSITLPLHTNFSILRACIPLVYLICGKVGKYGFKRVI